MLLENIKPKNIYQENSKHKNYCLLQGLSDFIKLVWLIIFSVPVTDGAATQLFLDKNVTEV